MIKKLQSEESVGFLKPQVHLIPTTLSQLKAAAGGLNDFLLSFEGGSNKMQGDYFKTDDMRQLLRMDLLANLSCCISCTLFPWAVEICMNYWNMKKNVIYSHYFSGY